ncbi:histidine kinase [Fragilaria crotonensis]|nr:histidine kinase [Fragilaria crotonensis]
MNDRFLAFETGRTSVVVVVRKDSRYNRRLVLGNASSMTPFPTVDCSPLDVIAECGHDEHRIDLSQVKLYGRSREVKMLRSGFHRACHGRSELIIIKGQPGAGKTRLVEGALRQYVAELEVNRGFFVRGKCERFQNEPFAAIVSAVTDLVDLILESEEVEQTTNDFNEAFSDVEIKELVQLIPKLAAMARQVPEMRIHKNPTWSDDCSQSGYAPFIFLFRSLIKFLVTSTRPVVLFLDDIHFIDSDSLNLLNSLVTDESSKHLLLVCSTGDLTAPLTFCNDALLLVSELIVGDLTLPHVAELFSDFFQVEDATPLMELVMSKTSANILHIIQFLELIRLQGFLKHGEDGWIYDLNDIQENAISFGSLDDLLDYKIRRLDGGVMPVMKVASFLGPRFRFDTLVHVCRARNYQSWHETARSVNEALQTAMRHGYVELREGLYSFVHESFQLCWYNMMKEERPPASTHLQIGMAIHSQMLIDQDSSLLFSAADNVWRGQSNAHSRATAKQALRLLHEASQCAVSRGMFHQAKSFAMAAVRLLEEDADHWTNQYRMSVDVYCNMVNVEEMIGNFENAYHAASEILAHSGCFDDSINARLLLIRCLGSGGKYEEAKRHGFEALCDLGEPIHQSNILIHTARELAHVTKALRNKTDEELVSSPLIQCATKVAAMRIMSSLLSLTFLSIKSTSDRLRFANLSLRMMSVSLTYGVCEESCVGFASYGVLLSNRGDHDGAIRYGRLALRLVNRFGAKHVEPYVVFIAHAFLLHYEQPLLECRGALRLQTYPKTLGLGDLDTAFHQGSLLVAAAVLSDSSLSSVEKEIAHYCKLMKHFRREAPFNLSVSSWQRTQNLMGLAKDPIILTGAVMKEETIVSQLKRDSHGTALAVLYLSKIGLALLFESWTTVATLIPNVEKSIRSLKGHLSQYSCYFYLAASSCALYRVTHHRNHRRSASRATKQLRKWKDDGVAVCAPMLTFIEAEWALTGGLDTTCILFLSAAERFASLKCYVNIQAMAYERIGSYFLLKGDQQTSAHFYAKALSKYEDWEAVAKIPALKLRLSLNSSKNVIKKPDLKTEGSKISFSCQA